MTQTPAPRLILRLETEKDVVTLGEELGFVCAFSNANPIAVRFLPRGDAWAVQWIHGYDTNGVALKTQDLVLYELTSPNISDWHLLQPGEVYLHRYRAVFTDTPLEPFGEKYIGLSLQIGTVMEKYRFIGYDSAILIPQFGTYSFRFEYHCYPRWANAARREYGAGNTVVGALTSEWQKIEFRPKADKP